MNKITIAHPAGFDRFFNTRWRWCNASYSRFIPNTALDEAERQVFPQLKLSLKVTFMTTL